MIVGLPFTIRAAYSIETGARTDWDEWAGCCGVVLAVHPDDTCDVRLRGGREVNIHIGRLRFEQAV